MDALTLTTALIFACSVHSEQTESDAIRMAESVRTFGGKYAEAPVWFMLPQDHSLYSVKNQSKIDSLHVRVIPYAIDGETFRFAFAPTTIASATAENEAIGKTEGLAWLDADAVILNEPQALKLWTKKAIAVRPVDQSNVGSPYGEPVNEFWKNVYSACKVDGNDVYAVKSAVDEKALRAYFNAGMLVVRPERKLLTAWRDNFLKTYQTPEMKLLYNQNGQYRLAVHQAVLAATIVKLVPAEEVYQLPRTVNFPLQLWEKYPQKYRPNSLDEIVSCHIDEASPIFKVKDGGRGIKEALKEQIAKIAIH